MAIVGTMPQQRAHEALTERQRCVLQAVVHLYIRTGRPASSRLVARRLRGRLNLSAASIRAIMAELEERRYLTHPHTSAGRIPTDRGYRAYVDSLTSPQELSEQARSFIERELSAHSEQPTLWQEASRVLSALVSAVGLVQPPMIERLPLRRIELISLSLTHVLVVLIFSSGAVRTLITQLSSELKPKYVELLARLLNQYLAGHSLATLRHAYTALQQELSTLPDPLPQTLQQWLEQLPELSETPEQIYVSGTSRLLHYPEFTAAEQLRTLADLLEHGSLLRRLLARYGPVLEQHPIFVGIGRELGEAALAEYAVILGRYQLGTTHGVVGIIGPKRIFYPKAISAVHSVARFLTELSPQT